MTRWLPAVAALACARPGPPPVCDGVSGLVVTRVAGHPGNGDEITARLRFDTGIPIAEADLVQCLGVEGAPGKSAVVRRPMDAAYTLLLVDPGRNQAGADNARSLVQAIVKKRPPGEALAVFRWGAAVTQVAPFASDRRVLLQRVGVGLAPSDGVLPAGDALAAAAAVLDQVGGPAVDALRTIVLVGARPAASMGLAAALGRAGPHLVISIGGDPDLQSALPAGLRFPIGGQSAPALVVAAMSDRMDAYARHSHYAFGVCGQAGQPVRLLFEEVDPTPVMLPPSLPEDAAGTCDAQAIAEGHRAFPARLDLLFTADQRAAAAAAFADRAHRPPFDLAARLSEGPPVRAVARYRGDASYDCARRSYALELEGERPRFLFPGSAARRFELASLCLDRMSLRTFAALRLLAEEGLFPVPFDLVEVAVDGVSQGPYLILEDPSDALRARSSGVSAVVRRQAGAAGGTAPQVRWSAGSAADAETSYTRILGAAMSLSGRPLESALEDRFDLQAYLTWVALMNLLGSGGYRDQIFFYAAQTAGPDGNPADFHLPMGWDEDALFTACGAPAIYDPRGLVTCAQAELDRRLFTDPLLYPRYSEVLASAIERSPPERFAGLAGAAAARIAAFLERPEVRAGMVELRALDPRAPVDPAVARQLLDNELALIVGQFGNQRAMLADRLARFRAER